MSKKFFKNTVVSLGLGHVAIFSVPATAAGSLSSPHGSASTSSPTFGDDARAATEESFRLTLPLGTPRRFATRYIKTTRTLQIRIAPARAEEMKGSEFFDTRYVRRVLVEDKQGEVVLNLQLRNLPIGWMVTTQDDPWRIVVDIWRAGPVRRESLDEQWSWQDDAHGLPTGAPSRSAAAAPSAVQRGHVSVDAGSPIDIPPADASHVTENKDSKETKEAKEPSTALTFAGRGAPTTSPGDAFGLPENFGPIERIVRSSPERISTLQRDAGAALGRQDEFEKLRALAAELHRSGDFAAALSVSRKLAVMSERRFTESDIALWQAGESAYLVRNFDAANDYLRTLLIRHPQSPLASQATLRLTDMELLGDDNETNKALPGRRYAEMYARIAALDTSTTSAKNAASVRLVAGKVESFPTEANLYQQNFNACASSDRTPIEMQKSCAYIQTRAALENSDVSSADKIVQRFKNAYPKDGRVPALERKVTQEVTRFLKESLRTRTWDAWIQFERSARPSLLDFTLSDPELTFARADAFETVGENGKAAQLYNLFWQNAKDEPKRDEAAAQAALLASKSKDAKRVDLNLKRLAKSETRKASGLNDRSVAALRTLSLAPVRNRAALSLLLDEMRYGRFVERELAALLEFAAMTRRQPASDAVFDKILQAPLKSSEETTQVEFALLRYADDLRDANRLQKSAEMYTAVANLSQGTKRAEAAYKAGLVYARAGFIEKAKQSWQSAASDLGDKRYSTLANERLERLR